MPVATKNRSKEVVTVLVTSLVVLGIYGLLQSIAVHDLWKSWQYQEDMTVREIREDLALTPAAERIFRATQPAIETAESFNEHCNSHRVDISLLGCYTNDQMYIYQVQLPELKEANKVTAAHELLHAVWVRMDKFEKDRVTQMLEDYRKDNTQWVEEETKLYQEADKLEELYTRVGTKVRDLPPSLEAHYAKYFIDRKKIVDFYDNYKAPFNKLIDENAQLKAEVDKLNEEIETERQTYLKRLATLEQNISEFNQCADTQGCFRSYPEFQARRKLIEDERENLNELRVQVNNKIDRNNEIIQQYQQNSETLGELNAALNSNLEKINEHNDEKVLK